MRRGIRVGAALTGFLLMLSMLGASGCSSSWEASIERKPEMGRTQLPLVIKMSSSLGGQFSGVLNGPCIEVKIEKSNKLKNQIAIQLFDLDGRKAGGWRTWLRGRLQAAAPGTIIAR